jgi:hypothetical protein
MRGYGTGAGFAQPCTLSTLSYPPVPGLDQPSKLKVAGSTPAAPASTLPLGYAIPGQRSVMRLDREAVRAARLAPPDAPPPIPAHRLGQGSVGLGGLGLVPCAAVINREAP